MAPTDLRNLFVSFRDHGDMTALAVIFDRTAPNLLELARRLSRSGADSADDLVQATFVSAIENRSRFDATRPLEPWLAGILANHALNARRRAAKRPSPLGDAAPISSDSAVDDRELWREVARATAALPPVYRDLVAPRVLLGERSRDVAKRSGRSPGVVRMQLHRGLVLLRRALPQGLLASFLLVIDSRVTLAAARAATLERGRELFALESAAAPAALAGGILVSKKLGLVLAALALGLVGFVLFHDEPAAELARPTVTTTATVTPGVVGTDRGDDSSNTVERAVAEAPASDPVVALSEPRSAPESYRRALSGVRGRLLESSREPAAGLELSLISLDHDQLVVDLDRAFEAGSFIAPIARATTDATGRFRFTEIEPTGFHAIGVDLGGSRATLRVIDVPLVSGEEIDLGDVVLGAVVALRGRIVDEEGEPVPDARVRAIPLPGPIAALGLERVTPDSLLMFAVRQPYRVEKLPSWLRSLLRALPIPTTRTSADGTFFLRGVAPGLVTTIADKEGFVARAFGPTPSRGDKEVDVGDLEMTRGRSIVGVVLDEARRPLENAEIAVGTTGIVKSNAILERHARTDASGRFEVRAVAEEGDAIVAVRAVAGARWAIFNGEPEPLELIVPNCLEHTILVRNELDEPVSDAEFRICAKPLTHSTPILERNDEWAAPHVAPVANAPGEYRLSSLPLGAYVGFARVPRSGLTRFEFEVRHDSSPTRVIVAPQRVIDVFVGDAATNAPVEHALVRVVASRDPDMTLARARTGSDGRCLLEMPSKETGVRFDLRTSHPAYAQNRVSIGDDVTESRISLERGCELVGLITTDGSPPSSRYLVVLIPRGGALDVEGVGSALPSVVTSSASGAFRVRNLPPGEYAYEIYDDLLSADLAAIATRATQDIRSLEPRSLALGGFSMTSGEETQLVIDLVVPGSGRNGTVEGRVTAGGFPLTTASVQVVGSSDGRFHQVDAEGRFTIRDVRPGETEVQLYDFRAENGGGGSIARMVRRTVNVEAGGVTVVDFKLAQHSLRIFVTDRGAPAEGVAVEAETITPSNVLYTACREVTAADGSADLAVDDPGKYRIVVDDRSRGYAVKEIELVEGAAPPVLHLDLESGITVAGEIEVDAAFGPGPWSLAVTIRFENTWLSRTIEVDVSTRRFRTEHLPAGKMRFMLSNDAGAYRLVETTVTTSREDLKLEFAAESGG